MCDLEAGKVETTRSATTFAANGAHGNVGIATVAHIPDPECPDASANALDDRRRNSNLRIFIM